jgi:hypothetical protein
MTFLECFYPLSNLVWTYKRDSLLNFLVFQQLKVFLTDNKPLVLCFSLSKKLGALLKYSTDGALSSCIRVCGERKLTSQLSIASWNLRVPKTSPNLYLPKTQAQPLKREVAFKFCQKTKLANESNKGQHNRVVVSLETQPMTSQLHQTKRAISLLWQKHLSF